MKKVLMVLGVLALTLTVATEAKAQFIMIGDAVFGPDSVVQDVGGGLEWLGTDLSTGRSYNDMIGLDGTNEFVSGGDFEGWRHADVNEVSSLFTRFGFPDVNAAASAANYPVALQFHTLFGITRPANPNSNFDRILAYTSSPFGQFQNCPLVDAHHDSQLGQATVGAGCVADFAFSTNGHWLVRDAGPIQNTAVPEPATMALFGTGLLGAFVRRRRS